MAKKKRWIVTASGEQSLANIRSELTSNGFAVGEILDEIGCIVGDATDEVAEKIRALPGVSDVSPDTPIDIGPPGSDVTW